MGLFRSSAQQGRASLFGLIFNTAVLAAVGSMAAGMLLDRLTTGPDAPLVALLSPRPAPLQQQLAQARLRQTEPPSSDQVDMTPTASIGRPLVINPCAVTPK